MGLTPVEVRKKPSIHRLGRNALIRFSWVILAALTGSLAGMCAVQVNGVLQNLLPLTNPMLAAALGISLFFSIRTLLEGTAQRYR